MDNTSPSKVKAEIIGGGWKAKFAFSPNSVSQLDRSLALGFDVVGLITK